MILIVNKGVKFFLLGACNYSTNIFLISVVHAKYNGNPPMAICEQIKSPTEQCLFCAYCSCFSLLRHKTGHAHEAYDYYHKLYTFMLNQNLHN